MKVRYDLMVNPFKKPLKKNAKIINVGIVEGVCLMFACLID